MKVKLVKHMAAFLPLLRSGPAPAVSRSDIPVLLVLYTPTHRSPPAGIRHSGRARGQGALSLPMCDRQIVNRAKFMLSPLRILEADWASSDLVHMLARSPPPHHIRVVHEKV